MSDDLFSKVEEKLAAARAAATLPESPSGFLARRNPKNDDARRSQNDFNLKMVDALAATFTAFREKAERGDAALQEAQQELVLLRGLSGRMNKTLERVLEAEEQLRQGRQEQRHLHQQLNDSVRADSQQLRNEQRELLEILSNKQRDLLEKLLNEQRVCLKQLALQASEEAVLADRTRRAAELQLNDFARRLDQLSANGSPPAA